MPHSINSFTSGLNGGSFSDLVTTNVFATGLPGNSSSPQVTTNTGATGVPGTPSPSPDIDWRYPGIHPKATQSDTADNYADTASLLANISTSIGGTGSPATALYVGGSDGDKTEIETVSGTKYVVYNQSSADRPQLWTRGFPGIPQYWVRLKSRFVAGWDRNNDGYKIYGWFYEGYQGRTSLEANQGFVYVDSYYGDGSSNTRFGYTPPLQFIEFPDPVPATIETDIFICVYNVEDDAQLRAVWFAPLGSEPQLVGLQYLLRREIEPLPNIESFMWGINMNASTIPNQKLYHRSWEIVPYADDPDPWKLLQIQGVSTPRDLRMPGALEITDITGTLSRSVGSTTLTLTGQNFLMGGNSAYMAQFIGMNISLDSFNIVGDTTMTLNVSCPSNQPIGMVPIILSPQYMQWVAAQSYPAYFEVIP